MNPVHTLIQEIETYKNTPVEQKESILTQIATLTILKEKISAKISRKLTKITDWKNSQNQLYSDNNLLKNDLCAHISSTDSEDRFDFFNNQITSNNTKIQSLEAQINKSSAKLNPLELALGEVRTKIEWLEIVNIENGNTKIRISLDKIRLVGSPVFEDCINSAKDQIVIKLAENKANEEFLNYIQNRCPKITSNNVNELKELAVHYQIPVLMEQCKAFDEELANDKSHIHTQIPKLFDVGIKENKPELIWKSLFLLTVLIRKTRYGLMNELTKEERAKNLLESLEALSPQAKETFTNLLEISADITISSIMGKIDINKINEEKLAQFLHFLTNHAKINISICRTDEDPNTIAKYIPALETFIYEDEEVDVDALQSFEKLKSFGLTDYLCESAKGVDYLINDYQPYNLYALSLTSTNNDKLEELKKQEYFNDIKQLTISASTLPSLELNNIQSLICSGVTFEKLIAENLEDLTLNQCNSIEYIKLENAKVISVKLCSALKKIEAKHAVFIDCLGCPEDIIINAPSNCLIIRS